jgi:4-aminobutyrate aminotransferase/4-aminobutyrate aminotransferase/(S)-3-amino-2-methylpropionate transaminase
MSTAPNTPPAAFELPNIATELPGPKSREWFERADKTITSTMSDHEIVPFVEASKRGSLIVDVDGNTFADHMSAWGASPFGATPERVKRAMDDAWDRHGMQISGWVQNTPVLELTELLSQIAPGRLTRTEYSVTGTLAVEGAVKLMREATGRPMILTFGGQYHGESTYLTAVTSSDLSNVTVGSMQYVAGVVTIPFPNRYRSPFIKGPGPFDDTAVLDYLEDYLLVQQVHPGQIAGVMIEPVLGEGGIHGPSQEFWDRLGAMCKKWGWLLCVDEVQTCMGRCGEMFAIELWDNIDADLVLLGKAFAAGGQPIAGILGTDEVLGKTDLHLGSTYGFVPAAAAAAIEGINIIQEGGVLENVRELERVFYEEMNPLKERVEQVGDVRAYGALAALEFVTDKETIAPAPRFQYAVYHAALKRGVLGITQQGKWHYRLQPALTMPPEFFRDSCRRIIEAVEEVAANPPAEGHVLDTVAGSFR